MELFGHFLGNLGITIVGLVSLGSIIGVLYFISTLVPTKEEILRICNPKEKVLPPKPPE